MEHIVAIQCHTNYLLHFIDLLTGQNPLFHKVNPMLTQSLLKLGKITSYSPG